MDIDVVSDTSAASVFRIMQEHNEIKTILKTDAASSFGTFLSLHVIMCQKNGKLITTWLLVFNFLRLINNNSKIKDGVRR
jgi:hypothetical protein